jgi:hypothetical protein
VCASYTTCTLHHVLVDGYISRDYTRAHRATSLYSRLLVKSYYMWPPSVILRSRPTFVLRLHLHSDAPRIKSKVTVFSSDPLYPESYFTRRFRVPRLVFDIIFEKLSVLPIFPRKPDALGNMGIHPMQRITGAMRELGYGYAYDAVGALIKIA